MEVNAAEFRRITGLSMRGLQTNIDAGMPVASHSGQKGVTVKIDTVEAIRWLIGHGQGGKRKKLTERERLAQEQANKVALENAVKRRDLISAETVKELMGSAFAELGSQLDGIGGRLANELAGIREPGRIRLLILGECRRVRSSFAESIAELAESQSRSEGNPSDPDAATETHRKRVGGSESSAPKRKRRTRTVAE